jgi:hypothetical protein
MHSRLKNPLVFLYISAAVFSTSLLIPFTVVNSYVLNYDQSDAYSAHGGYDDKNLNSVHEMAPTTYNQAQPHSVLGLEFHEEDFTGDSVSFLVNANNVDK